MQEGLRKTDVAFGDNLGRRRYRRQTAMLSGVVSVDGAEFTCQVINISAGGAKIKLRETLPAGTLIQLTISRVGPVPGKIVWQGGNSAGVEFQAGISEVTALFGQFLPARLLEEDPN